MSGIDVAEGDNVFAAELFEIGCALAADAYASDVEFAAWWCFSIEPEDVARDDHEGGGGDGRGAEESAAGEREPLTVRCLRNAPLTPHPLPIGWGEGDDNLAVMSFSLDSLFT
jgi:hypothetical protein